MRLSRARGRSTTYAKKICMSVAELRSLDEASDPRPADYPYGQPGLDQRFRPLD
jgi:hypothetical protein